MISIDRYLRDARVPYTVVPHHMAFTAQQGAAAVHVRGRNWAKVVVCIVDGQAIEAVVPAHMEVNLPSLLALTGGSDIRVAAEDELTGLFPDCALGAMPPLGPLYGQSVFVDVALAGEPAIIFNAGTHTEAVGLRWADFARTVRPIVGVFAERRGGVGAFRLSYRE